MKLSLEDIIIQSVESTAAQMGTQVAKIVADLFKTALLKKYRSVYNQELTQGLVHGDYLDKTIDYYFAEVCFVARTKLKNISEQAKDAEINNAKLLLPEIKQYARKVLEGKGVKILD